MGSRGRENAIFERNLVSTPSSPMGKETSPSRQAPFDFQEGITSSPPHPLTPFSLLPLTSSGQDGCSTVVAIPLRIDCYLLVRLKTEKYAGYLYSTELG